MLLLDEPLGALDLKLRKQMQIELKRIQPEVGITFIYVTHDQEEAMTMSDRIAVMNRGRYEQLGSPEELYERPQTRFVAGFLGASNLIPGTVVDREHQLGGRAHRRRHDPSRCPVARRWTGRRSSVGVRPEKIRLTDVGADGQPRARTTPLGDASGAASNVGAIANELTGSIRSTAYTGVSTQYQVGLDDGREVQVYEQNLERALGVRQRAIGDRVRLTWSPEDTFAVGASGPAESSASSSPSSATVDVVACRRSWRAIGRRIVCERLTRTMRTQRANQAISRHEARIQR